MRPHFLRGAVTAWPQRHDRVLPLGLCLLALGCDRHTLLCDKIASLAVPLGGFDAPGVAGNSRWGLPLGCPSQRRVRRSWSSLSALERRQVIDALLLIKTTTPDGDHAGSRCANSSSLCERTGELSPASGDPDLALPDSDWNDRYKDGEPGAGPRIFEPDFFGSAGSCDAKEDSVRGPLIERGFQTSLSTNLENSFSPAAASVIPGPSGVPSAAASLSPAPPSRPGTGDASPSQSYSATRRLAATTTPCRPSSHSQRG